MSEIKLDSSRLMGFNMLPEMQSLRSAGNMLNKVSTELIEPEITDVADLDDLGSLLNKVGTET